MKWCLALAAVWLSAAVALHSMRVQRERENKAAVEEWLASETSNDVSRVRCDVYPTVEPAGPLGFCFTTLVE